MVRYNEITSIYRPSHSSTGSHIIERKESIERKRMWMDKAVTCSIIFAQVMASVPFIAASAEPSPRRHLVDLEDLYRIREPDFSYGKLRMDLEYHVNDLMEDSSIAYRLFDGHACEVGANDITFGQQYLLSRLRPDLKPVGNGTDTRIMKVSVGLDPFSIQDSPVHHRLPEYETVKFCVRFSVYNMDANNDGSMEVNFIETPVQLDVHFIDNEMVSIFHSDTELVIDLAQTNQAVEAYICDKDFNVIEVDEQNPGESVTIRICIVPVDKVMEEGAYLKSIDELYFYRDGIMQEALVSGTLEMAATGVKFVDCDPGDELCVFEVTLQSDFFLNVTSTSTINGTGVAHLQIGEDDSFVNNTNATVLPGNNTRHLIASSVIDDSSKRRRRLIVVSTKFSFELAVVPKMKAPVVPFRPSGADSLSSIVSALMTVVLTLKLLYR